MPSRSKHEEQVDIAKGGKLELAERFFGFWRDFKFSYNLASSSWFYRPAYEAI